MKLNVYFIVITFFILSIGCKTTQKINKVIEPKEVIESPMNAMMEDSIKNVRSEFNQFKNNTIKFKTFSAKIKVESNGKEGKNPDITAVVKIIKDSAIWMSLSATILNYEVYRVLITKDSVILMNKKDKEVLYRSLDYLQEVAQIPFDYSILEDLIIGNPVFMGDTVVSYRKENELVLLSTVDSYFKNLFSLNASDKKMFHSKMDDIDPQRNRTADITYNEYDFSAGFPFSTERQIIASEKNKIQIKLNFKQFEFDKDLTVSFNVPKNYIRK